MQTKVIGKLMPIAEAYEKVTGLAKYTGDISLPSMLYAAILGSPYPHARVKSIDISEARRVPGVISIITFKEIPQVEFHPHETRPMHALTDHARCIGDEIAAVAAETREKALEALDKINVEYEILPAVYDPVEALKPDAPKLYPEGNLTNLDGKPYEIKWGNIEEEIRNAAVVVDGTFKTQIHVTTPIEPRSCVAAYNPRTGELTAWVTTQFPHRVREDIATVCGIPVSKVRVITHFFGGGFGGKKQERYPIIAALLAIKSERPVRLEYTRMQEFLIGRRRAAANMNATLAADSKGNFTALKFEAYYDVGAYGNFVGGSLNFLVSQLYTYKFRSALFRAYDVCTNTITAQPFRGVQLPAFHFAIEQLIDQIGEKLNIDPFKLRLQNTYSPGESMPPFGAKLSSYAVNSCAEKVMNVIKWDSIWRGYGKAVSANGSRRTGIGVAFSLGWCDWAREYTSAIVKIESDGTAVVITGTQDVGTSNKQALRQIVAEELALNVDDVNIVTGDTRETPMDYGCCASRTTFVGGLAVKYAAEQAKRKLLNLAAKKLEVSVEDLVLEDKKIYVKGVPDKTLRVADVIQSSIIGECTLPPSPKITELREKTYIGGAAVHLAVVEVDMETGEVHVLKYVAAHDVGRAINPAAVKDQIMGAVIQGLGYALLEELCIDRSSGSYLNPTYAEYKIPSLRDTPEILPIIIEEDEPLGPFGAKGIGEHAINPVAAAIANAIYNATGKRVTELPMTPFRIYKSITSS
jgi:xanthine dehydrogenase molybdenum-binding subunit